jgi:hypothetical protein
VVCDGRQTPKSIIGNVLSSVPFHKHTLSTLQLRDSATTALKCSREIWEHFLSRYSIVLLLRSIFSHLCVLLLRCALMCVFYSLPYSCFDCDQLCKAWETPVCGDSSQLGYWYKEDNSGTQVWSSDHLRGVECNPWPKEVNTRGVGIGWTMVKIAMSLVHFTYCDYYLLEISYSL